MEYPTVLEVIGQTPLVRLQKLSPNPEVKILAKLEYLNPSSSIKDRIAKHIIEWAEKEGRLLPGGTIVENTSGNTGAAVAMMAAIKGYRAILTLPDKVSEEKQNALKAYGAEVVVCPTSAPPESPEHYVNKAKVLADAIPGSFRLDQYNNPKNPEAHYFSTGPELWEQTGGEIDYFIAAGSTGGTISGSGKYLKEKKPNVQLVLPDPIGSVFHPYLETGELPKEGNCCYHVEGVGEDHLVGAMNLNIIDRSMPFNDQQAFGAARRLAREEGILAGGSAGANVWAALEIAKELKGPATIVVMIPDGGVKYLSKIYNDNWMNEHGLMERERDAVCHTSCS